MGTIIFNTIANYSASNVNQDFIREFDILSDHISEFSYVGNDLSFKNSGTATNYETAANSTILGATVTMPTTSAVAANVIIIGVMSDGNYAALYLSGANAGKVMKFWKDGHTTSTALSTVMAVPPNVAKGVAVTYLRDANKINIKYGGTYDQDLLFSSIGGGFSYPVIGVLGTGSAENKYTFIITA